MERADKIISAALNLSRKDAAALIKKGKITANGNTVKNAGEKFDENSAVFMLDGAELSYSKYVYIMMNKPKGVISASNGNGVKTVIDILPDDMKRRGLFPAGRLDRDTTGFMLITNDGDFAHRILSPKNHVPKTYIAKLDKPFNSDIINDFENGVKLKDGLCMPAKLVGLNDDFTLAQIEIKQGMYHQIKRMFSAYNITVVELKRVKIGALSLDASLKLGQCRYLTQNEIEIIKSSK